MEKTVSLLCIKTKSGAHKQLTFYFQMWKYFCRHLHSSLISMGQTKDVVNQVFLGLKVNNFGSNKCHSTEKA
jgi:hypothetical protein